MSIVYSNKSHGNLKLFDLRPHVNLNKLTPSFHRLRVDPYYDDCGGSVQRRKHVALLIGSCGGRVMTRLNKDSVIERISDDVVEERTYAPIVCDDQTLKRVVDLFLLGAEASNAQEARFSLLIQFLRRSVTAVRHDGARRYAAAAHQNVEIWHKHGVDKVGVVCVARESIIGGVHEFSDSILKRGASLTREVPPGHMMIWNDAEAYGRLSELELYHGHDEGAKLEEGHLDTIVLGYTAL